VKRVRPKFSMRMAFGDNETRMEIEENEVVITSLIGD
jgi:hypothetical protein